MKFANIPQYIRTSGLYVINVDWDRLLWFLDGAVNKKGTASLNLDPGFQRGRVWTPKQQTAYVEYKLQGGYGADNIYTNCPGWMNDFRGPYELVDGLQRITAVTRFLKNEIPAFGNLCKDFEDDVRFARAQFIWHVHSLDSRADVLAWYLQMNGSGTPHAPQELARVEKLLEAEKKKAAGEK